MRRIPVPILSNEQVLSQGVTRWQQRFRETWVGITTLNDFYHD
jgi:hypothetical protein